MKTYYRDVYGCTASITEHKDGRATLTICGGHGTRVCRKVYKSKLGAKIALGKWSDGWSVSSK